LINKAIAASYEVKTPVRNPEKPASLFGYFEKVKERGNPEETSILPGNQLQLLKPGYNERLINMYFNTALK